jgi:hypothetical protein
VIATEERCKLFSEKGKEQKKQKAKTSASHRNIHELKI